jgi:hypothetical protein
MGIVPAELLVPPDAHARGFCHDDAAVVLDGWLRRLASQETRCRRVLGRLAAVFLQRAGHHELGFARVNDYSTERLGISGRELQSLATVTERLDALPETSAAFDRGELSWTQVRLLIGVVTADSETAWIGLARGRTVRGLEALIREFKIPPPDVFERPATFRLRCPQRVFRLWHDTVELARRVAGAQLTQGQAAEAIAAEGLSARPVAEPEPVAEDSPRLPADPDERRCAFSDDLDWTPIVEAAPEDVTPLAGDLDDLGPIILDARLRVVVRAMQRIAWQQGRLLRVFLDRRLHRVFRFPSAARYLRERLGMSGSRARALAALDRKSWDAPGLGEAYRDGALSWTQAVALVPVAHEETIDAWIARARAVTIRRLLDEVEWAIVANDGLTPLAGAPLVMPERQMRARDTGELPDAELGFTASVTIVSLFRAAVRAFTPQGEPPWRGLEALLEHARAEWMRQPRHRDPIFARDRWRCAVPICTSRRNLHDHHVVFRSRGGGNARENRITLCAWHHLRGIHGGRLRAEGEAPDGITWEIGRPPLLRLQGDRYADGLPPEPGCAMVAAP